MNMQQQDKIRNNEFAPKTTEAVILKAKRCWTRYTLPMEEKRLTKKMLNNEISID